VHAVPLTANAVGEASLLVKLPVKPTVTEPAGAMVGHSEIAFAIDAQGRVRQEMDFDPGPGTAATESSFAAELVDAARQLVGKP